jgi:ribosomal-protein-alanine N-acetyltransferase
MSANPTKSEIIETERLILRPWSIDDVPYYKAMSTDVGYNCFNTPGIFLVKNHDEALLKVKARIKTFEDHKIGKFLIFEKETGSFFGTCGGDFFDFEGSQQIELGYRMMLAHWGKGFASESAIAMVNYLLNDLKKEVVYGFALNQNIQSLKILEKIGFEYQKEFMWAGLSHKFYEVRAKKK